MNTATVNAQVEPRETFPALNGLRLIAALAVVFFHYTILIRGWSAHVPWWINNPLHNGNIAVGFFYVLSGFVLAHRYPAVKDRGRFWFARFARLYPAYLFAFLLFAPLAAQKFLRQAHSPVQFLEAAGLNLTMLQAWTNMAESWNGPSWSLSVEAFFYFAFPFLIVWLRRRPVRDVLLGATLLTAVPAAITLWYFLHGYDENLWRYYFDRNPLLWTPLFILGIACALIQRDWLTKVSDFQQDLIAAAAIIGMILATEFCPPYYKLVLANGAFALLIAALVLSSARQSGWTSKLFGNRFLAYLGGASYIMYIVQSPLWHFYSAGTNYLLHRPVRSETVEAWQFVSYLVVLVLFSLAIQTWLEAPVRNWLMARYGKATTAPIQPTLVRHTTAG